MTQNRLIPILKVLWEQTDETHSLTTNDIIAELAKQGIPAHRTTVAQEIEELQHLGYDIVCVKSTQNRYFIGSRTFELAELKLLTDAVLSSKFITSAKSAALIKKLATLTSSEQAKSLQRSVQVLNRVKPDNEQIYYWANDLQTAINGKKKVTFQYIEWTASKRKSMKHNGEVYSFSPYEMLWDGDFYYVIGFDDRHDEVIKFRVDKIVKLCITEFDAAPQPAGFSVDEYINRVFRMYNGRAEEVVLKCKNECMGAIIDKFGKTVKSFPIFVSRAADALFKCQPTAHRWHSLPIQCITPQSLVLRDTAKRLRRRLHSFISV